MNHAVILAGLAVLLLAGCEYEAPLTTAHTIAVDASVLGVWEPVRDEGRVPPGRDMRVTILRYSDTEYLVHYLSGGGGLFFRAYPIQIGGLSCVQLQGLGTHQGPPAREATRLFHVFSCEIEDDELVLRPINTKLIDSSLTTREELEAAFLRHKENPDLFREPDRFRRVAE